MSSRKTEAVAQQQQQQQQNSSSLSPPSRRSEILVVYSSADASDSLPVTEAGFELILNDDSIAEPIHEAGETESPTTKEQPKNNMRHFTPYYSKNDKKTSTSISPTGTVPLTPLSASAPRQRSPASVTDFEWNEDHRGGFGSPYHNTWSLPLQRLVCTKQTVETSIEHDSWTKQTDDTTTSHKRRPLLQKLICQKYKPNDNHLVEEVHQARMASDLHRRVSAKHSKHLKQDRLTTRKLLSSTNQLNSIEQDEPVEWKTGPNLPFADARQDVTIITPRIVQRLERTEVQRQKLQNDSIPNVQHSCDSLRLKEHTQHGRERDNEANSIPMALRYSNPDHARRKIESSRNIQYSTEASAPYGKWKNEVPSSPIRFLGGSAYQRRIQRFQKEHGTPTSAEFVFGSGQGDDESSFVEWVEQIENEKVNRLLHTSSQGVGLDFSPNGNNVPTPNTITIPIYSKVTDKSLNTTAETSAYSSIGFGDDILTRDTASHLSEEEYHWSTLPIGTATLRRASFDVSTAPISVGSIDSHHFGRSAFVHATPEDIVAAARAGDFDDDDDMWSGSITVKDEEFALAGVYSTPQLPF
jgi:hypothetical protein